MKGKLVIVVLVVALVGLMGARADAGVISFFSTEGAADPAIKAHLEASGHTVNFLNPQAAGTNDAASQQAAAEASDLVLISETIGSATVLTGGVFNLIDVTTAILSFEAFIFDDMQLCGPTPYVHHGNSMRTEVPAALQPAQTDIYITDPLHPIAVAAGLGAGAVPVWANAYSCSFALSGPEANVVATADAGGVYPTLLVYESGSKLWDGSAAPGRRGVLFIGQGLPNPDFANLTPQGIALLDATVTYMMSEVQPLPGDVNGDCVVNILDMIGIRNHLNEDPTSPPGNAVYDVTEDGSINILDMIFVRNNLNTTCADQ